MRQFLYIAMLLLFARVCNPCAAQQPNKPLIDTARINAMRDSAGSRIMQVFDVDMLSKCLQVKQIENIRSLSLLKLNTPLRDTIEAFRVGYGTDILVHSYISSEQFWPKVIFNPNRLTRDIGNATKSPAVGFDVSFTPYGRGSERKFAIDITNQATANLLSDAQLTTLKGVTKKGIKGQFRKLSPDGKDSVNASLFRGIATLRGYWENELSKCNIQKVTFTPIAKPIYGFDTEPNETMKNFYERLVLSGRNYNVPWKSIEAGKEEDIIARISLKDSNPATHKVNFRREKASPPIVKANGDGTYTLTLTGGSNKDEEIIEAFYTDTLPGGKTKESVVGKIKVKSYSPIKSKVIPVKMNGASFSESTVALENALNDIYKQAAVSWTVAEPISVTVDQNTWDVDEKDGVLLIETSPLRRYSREMQAIIDAVKKDGKYDSEASYAIITDLPNSEGYAGYMPLKSDFAFIFTKSNGDLKKLIPHELGHGVFYLKHPQDEYHILDATDNLMDKYAVGTTLWKPQWDWIGDPSWRLYMFQEESDGAMMTDMVFDHNIKIGGMINFVNYIISDKGNFDYFKQLLVSNNVTDIESLDDSFCAFLLKKIFENKIQIDNENEAKVILIISYQILAQIELLSETELINDVIDNNYGIDNTDLLIDKMKEKLITRALKTLTSKYSQKLLSKYISTYIDVKVTRLTQSTSDDIFKSLSRIESNQRYKDVLRNVFDIADGKPLQNIMSLKAVGKEKEIIKNLIEECKVNTGKLNKLAKYLSIKEIEINTSNSNKLISLSLKNKKFFETTSENMPLLDAALFFSKLYQGKESPLSVSGNIVSSIVASEFLSGATVTTASLAGAAVGSFAVGTLFIVFDIEINRIMNEIEVGVDGLPKWSDVLKWKSSHFYEKYNQTDLVMQYIEEKGKYNYCIPTSIRVLDIEIGKKIFGFEPKFVNYDFPQKGNFTPKYYVPCTLGTMKSSNYGF